MDIVEKPGDQVPLDLQFQDQDGKKVRLGDLFDGKTPRILNLAYYRCPMLCGLIWNGLVDGMQKMDWTLGKEFGIITASIDPTEGPALARLKKQEAIKNYGRPGTAAGWTFLTGEESQSRALAEAVGWGYKYNEENGQYAHAAALVVLTPEGRVSRYLYGVQFDPQTLRLSLLEANKGATVSAIDRIILYCCRYDPQQGRYTPVAVNIMRLGGFLMVVVLGAVLTTFWVRDTRRRHHDESSEHRS